MRGSKRRKIQKRLKEYKIKEGKKAEEKELTKKTEKQRIKNNKYYRIKKETILKKKRYLVNRGGLIPKHHPCWGHARGWEKAETLSLFVLLPMKVFAL